MNAQVAPTRLQPLAVLRRRRWPMLIALAVALVATILAAFLWPATYRSTGTVLIEQQELPVDLVRSTISTYADQRIQMINQRVMTSDNLMGIVQKYNLYQKLRQRRGREAILDRMREDIGFGSIKASVIDPRQGRPVEATIAFSLSYKSRSPEIAARVANELCTLYLQENLQSRKQLAEQAADFLTQEGDKLSRHINELQAQVAKFKGEHVNNLPEDSTVNMQLVNRADDEKRDTDSRISSLDQQITFLDAQLAQVSKTSSVYASTGERVMAPADRLKYLKSEYAHASAIYSPDHPDVVRMKHEIEGLEAGVNAEGGSDDTAANDRARQLQDAQTQLASAREKYSPDHPDVVRLEKLVASLSAPAPAATPTAPPVAPQSADNPAYIQLQAQREAAVNERASLQTSRAELVSRIATLEGRMASAPGVEKDYVEMLRELDNTQSKYKEVRQKQMEAQLAQNLEDERKGERFTLIDPPVAPEEPASPNRKLLLALGVALALALAIGVAALLEAGDRSVRGRDDVAGLLAVAPLAVIPWIQNEAQRTAQARQRRYAWIGSVASVVVMLLAVHFFYRPLDVVWSIAMRRLGS